MKASLLDSFAKQKPKPKPKPMVVVKKLHIWMQLSIRISQKGFI
jgi:hypothetical protein